MAITYNIFRSDGTLDFQIEEGTVVDSHGLRFTGYQKPSYGDAQANNLLKLLENFATFEDINALQIIVSQDENDYDDLLDATTNGTFNGGSGYSGADTIELSNRAVITVNSVNITGGVTSFTVTDIGYLATLTELSQASTSGSGIGFTLTPDTNNTVSVSTFPPESAVTLPLTGQMWFDKTVDLPHFPNGQLRIYNGTIWAQVNNDVSTDDGPINVQNGTGEVILPQTSGIITITNIASHDDFDDHVTETVGAHTATAIFFDDTVDIPGDNVQLAIFDVQGNLEFHITNLSGAHAASAISTTVAGSIPGGTAQTSFQALKDELNIEQTQITNTAGNLAAHIPDVTDAHDASAITFDPFVTGDLPGAFHVQDALVDLNTAVGNSDNQSVIDSLRVVRTGVQNFNGDTWTKIQFNTLQFGDDLGQWDSFTNRYTANFNHIVRVFLTAGCNNIHNESFIRVAIYKNGSVDRIAEEWRWPENAGTPGDAECSAIIELGIGDYIEGWIYRANPGVVAVDTLTTRTAIEFDIIKAIGTPPPVGPAGDWKGARDVCCSTVMAEEWEDVYRFLYDNLASSKKFQKQESWESGILAIAEHLYKHGICSDPEINAAALFITLSTI